MCAGITMRTFSADHLVPQLEKKWNQDDQLPETGFKIGIASSPLLTKRIGIVKTTFQDLVWPGKAVNYAAKAAQSADRHELAIAGSVWDAIEKNDYLTFSCDCKTPDHTIWQDHEIESLDHDSDEKSGRLLSVGWCAICGPGFLTAILDGQTTRDTVNPVRAKLRSAVFASSLASKRARERESRRNLNARIGALR